MTKRYLWTIVGAAVCLGASPAGVLAAKAPDDWVCNTKTTLGTCKPEDDIVVKDSRPIDKYGVQVRHLVKNATFRINYDGSYYTVELLHKEWLVGFEDAKLKWKEQDDEDGTKLPLMPEAVCADLENPAKFKAQFKDGKFIIPNYARFFSDPWLKLHMQDGGKGIQEHLWLIYPIGNTATPTFHAYCLVIPPDDGGSHDGAVHGEG